MRQLLSKDVPAEIVLGRKLIIIKAEDGLPLGWEIGQFETLQSNNGEPGLPIQVVEFLDEEGREVVVEVIKS